jgi:hypothetical protein
LVGEICGNTPGVADNGAGACCDEMIAWVKNLFKDLDDADV